MNPDDFRVDRTAFAVIRSHQEAAEEDRRYWLSRTPHERLIGLELTRQALYGYDPATARLQRVLEITTRAPG